MNVQYQITEQDYINANKISAKYRHKNWHNRIFIFSFCFILGILGATFSYHYSDQLYFFIIAIILLIGYAMFITKHTMKFEYANNAFIKLPMNLTINEEGCLFICELSQETVHWKNIYQYIESEQYWLIHISPHLMHIVLKSAFSAEEKQQFSAMLKQNIGERSKIDKKMWGK